MKGNEFMNVDEVRKKEEKKEMNTDLFKICQRNTKKIEEQKREEQRQWWNDSMSFLLTVAYIAGMLSCLAIYDVCHWVGLV